MPGAPGQVQAFNYMAICKMTEYAHKSFEELRFEDYQKGNKGTAAAATTAFGAAAPSPAPGFGAAPSPFGGAANASPFGGAAPGAAPAFGAAPTPFGKPYASDSLKPCTLIPILALACVANHPACSNPLVCGQERHPEARHRRPPSERHQHRIARSGSNPALTNTLAYMSLILCSNPRVDSL